ncbi:MAG: PEP-CTERM sorting domain-containing protein [Gemmatimonadaceae bacterium]|nr:PEP-CTERM sorting domain-containing protein [Gemmatimonadaceae bacterium]
MRNLLRLAVAATLLSAPGTVVAQTFTSNVSATQVAATVGTYSVAYQFADVGTQRVGPYALTFDMFDGAIKAIVCVDFNNHFQNAAPYLANLTLLSSDAATMASRTRVGQVLGGDVGLTRYTKMVWLALQFETEPTTQWGGIHGAIWSLQGAAGGPAVAQNPSIQFWLDQLAGADLSTVDLGGFAVVTDTRTLNGLGGSQEFLVRSNVVPEPSTYLLLATGMLGVAILARRRRRAA